MGKDQAFYLNIINDGEVSMVAVVKAADSIIDKMIGLIGTKGLVPGTGLWIRDCNSIHTCFMRYSIDVIFLDSKFKILKIVDDVAPFSVVFGGWRSRSVIEFQTGWLPLKNIKQGNFVQFIHA